MQWFYELDGYRHGPVPAKTIRQLARNGVIHPQTSLWSDESEAPIPASRVRDLFPSSAPFDPNIQRVMDVMSTALAACRDDNEDSLGTGVPPIFAVHPFANTHVLLEYSIASVDQAPESELASSKAVSLNGAPVQRIFRIAVRTELCFRTSHRARLAELRHTKPGHKHDSFVYLAKEFSDGSWEIDSP